jgi:hypothetical protein
MKAIARHQEHITLNPYEFLLEEENGDVKLFETDESAVNYLNEKSGENMTKNDWENESGIHIVEWDEFTKES